MPWLPNPQAPPTKTELGVLDQTIGRGVKPLWVVYYSNRDTRIGDGRRPADAVDYVQDAAGSVGRIKEDRQ